MSLRDRVLPPRRPRLRDGGLYPPPAGTPARCPRAERAAHVATTAHVQAAYPFVAEGGLGSRGIYIGRDVYGASFVFDPYVLYERGVLTSPNMLVVGTIGSGKSALLKTMLYRGAVFGRRTFILDVKREYGPLAHALGVRTIALEPGGNVRLNPLTPRAGRKGQLELLQVVCAAAVRRALEPEEEAGLREALDTVRAQEVEPTLPQVVDVLLRPTAEMADRLATTPERLAEACRAAALGLSRLCQGDLQGMFDGLTTPGLDLDAALVVLDLHALYNSAALGILMACAASWLRAQVDAQREHAERTGRPAPKLTVVIDEAWRVLSDLGVGEWLMESFKLARQTGVQNVAVMHRLRDLQAAGAQGSRQVRIAEGLLADAQTRVVYRQPPDQVELTAELLGLTQTERELVPQLERGEALWKVANRSFYIVHRRGSIEQQITDTDQGMSLRPLDATGATG